MTKEQEEFITILANHLNSQKSEIDEAINWDLIHKYALDHQVSGIVCQQCKQFMPSHIRDVFQKELMATVYSEANRDKELNRIKDELHREGIPFFIVKGPVIAQLYPMPYLRTMGDVDLVVQNNNRMRCNELLLENNYTCLSKQEDREWQYTKMSFELELHDRLVYDEAVNKEGQNEFFNDCWKYVHDGELNWSFHLVFLIFHLRKHLMNSGVGFRQFMDLAIVSHKMNIDWEWVKKSLDLTGMLEFARKCFGFVYRWFGFVTPLTVPIDEYFYNEATIKIFSDGVFGFDNDENNSAIIINQVRKSKFPEIVMIKNALRQIFPPLRELKNSQAYDYLNQFPCLLPMAWIHRMHRGRNAKKARMVLRAVRESFVSDQQIIRREEQMKKWGL